MNVKILALAALVGLTGCGTLSEQDMMLTLQGAEAAYTVYCTTNPSADACTADAKKKAQDAAVTAEKAIKAYEADQNGKDSKALLKKAEQALQAALALLADF